MAVISNENGTVRYLSVAKAAVLTPLNSPPPAVKPTNPENIPVIDGFGDISPWGDDNLFPQHVIEDCEPSTIIPTSLERQSRILQSSGLMYGIVEGYKDDGEEIFKPQQDPIVEAWMRQTNMKRYLREASSSFYWFYNTFPEIILSKDRSMITHIYSKRPEFCRWSKSKGDYGFSKLCYLFGDWEYANSEAFTGVKKVSVIDPYFETRSFLESGKDWKYIYPMSYPSPGKLFYQLAPWNAVRTSGWLDVSKSIPTFKKALFTNQINIKYLISISTWWWNWAYPGFDKLDHEKKQSIMDGEIKAFEDFMTGDGKAGSSIISTFQSDPMNQKQYDGWKIEAVDNKLKDGIYIEDSQEAASHLLYALGIDPTLLGSMPGSKMGSGSGSDKRVAYNVYLSMIEPHRDIILEPLQFIFDYNGWPYHLKFRNTKIMTLDQGAAISQQMAG